MHLLFTNQKNSEKDEALLHGNTTEPLLSPLKAVRRRVEHLRNHQASPDTPLHTVYLRNGQTKRVRSKHITRALRASCKVLGTELGITYNEISARALRAGGAMALLRARVDPTIIRMRGRWKSWTMIQYLHRSAMDTSSFATRMLEGGNFVISKHATLPDDISSILDPTSPM